MLKGIKNILRIIIIAITTITVVLLILMLFLNISSVQTFISKKISGYISREINTTISIGRIKYSYFNRLYVNNLLIKDQNRDTLLFVPELRAVIRYYDFNTGTIKFSRVSATKPRIALITDSTGMMNLKWYLNKLKSNSKKPDRGKTSVFINRINIVDGRFRLEKREVNKSKTPVDFNNLHLDLLYATVNNLGIYGDSIAMDIDGLRFRESSGFVIKNLSAGFKLYNRKIFFNNAEIESDSSFIDAPLIALIPDSASTFRNFANDVKLEIHIRDSRIYGPELKYFVPVRQIPENIMKVEGRVSGTLSELRGKNIKITLPENTSLNMNLSLSGLPDIKNTFIFFEINRFETTPSDIEKLKIPDIKPLILPQHLRYSGKISFSGTFTGFLTDFVTYGRLYTSLGKISTDISMRPVGSGKFRLKGLITGSEIDIGKIYGNSSLFGTSTITADVEGEMESFKKFAINLSGRIDSIEVNSYRYRNIALNGYFTDKTWDGTIKVEDENINMELLGMFDLSKELPEFDFTLNLKNANLFRLNIDKKDTTAAASLLLTANFSGNNIDNLNGEIKLLNSNFRKFGKNLQVHDFSLKTSSENYTGRSLVLNTDFFNMIIKGQYNFSTLGNEIRMCFASMFPSRFRITNPVSGYAGNNFEIQVNFKKIDALNDFLKTGLSISENTTVSGIVRPDSMITFWGKTNVFGIRNNYFNNLTFEFNYKDSLLNAGLKTSSINILNLTELKNFSMNFSTNPDHFSTILQWDDHNSVANKGFFEAAGEFVNTGDAEKKGEKYLLKLGIQPGEIYVKNNLWKINPAEITIDSSSVKFTRFLISNNKNFFSVEGVASHDKNDTITVKINGINISGLNNLYEKKSSGSQNKLHLSLGGIMGGTISFTDIYKNFMFESDIRINNFALLESNYGEVRIGSLWNKSKKIAEIEINNNIEGKRMLDVTGYYDPDNKVIDLTAKANSLPMEIMNPLLRFFASGITGSATGNLRLKGEINKPLLTGSLYADNTSIKIDYLQSKLRFSDSIRFAPDAIRFNNITFRDERGNTGTLNGSVFHNHFKDFSVDLTIRTNDCMVLNTRSKDNELFYGTAFATGVTTIKTTEQALKFDISAKTGRNTRFFIPLNTGMSVTENSFITFSSPEDTTKSSSVQVTSYKQTAPAKAPMEIAFDLEVTPDAEVQLIMDPKTGDIMKGSGSGNLNISLDRKGLFRIFGDYTIESGDYLFTLGNIINKSFSVQSGGKISFNGEVDKAEIDIKAVYKTKASLYDIMPGMLPDARLRERIPVECLLVLTGKLFNPVVGFDINLPTADEETRAYLRSIIKSEEEMSRQFLFLLVMNSFYADPSAGTQLKTADIGSATVGVTTMEMLSNQLSNWLSQISKDFDIGVVYRPGSSALPNSQELQVALSTQLLNDRVTINGNFDLAGNQAAGRIGTSSTNTVTGAFDIEYKISEHLRFKFFNRSNDNFYIDNGVQYTQGIGLFYRQDFNKLKDIFGKKEKSPFKKEEEVKIVDK